MRTPMLRINLGIFLAAAMSLFGGSASAIVLGTNITISDNNNDGSNPAVAANWYSNREDNETENTPNTLNAQVWDLEGMYRNGTKLTLVGGFDFQNGLLHSGTTFHGGDLFIDINGDAIYGAGNGGSGTGGTVNNRFGYDYVLDIEGSTFKTYALNGSTVVDRATDVASSNPWKYDLALSGTPASLSSGAVTYGELTSGEITAAGLLGDTLNTIGSNTHYFMTLDLANVPYASIETFHYTIECGNDNLMGRYVPDQGATLLLLGASLIALEAFRRKYICA